MRDLETCRILREFMVCMTVEIMEALWIPSDSRFPLLAFVILPKSMNIKNLWSFLGFECVNMWQGLWDVKILQNAPCFLCLTLESLTHCLRMKKCYFLLAVPLLPRSNTAPTETNNKTSPPKEFSMNATFIRPWKELNEAGRATIKFHVCVFQETMHLS